MNLTNPRNNNWLQWILRFHCHTYKKMYTVEACLVLLHLWIWVRTLFSTLETRVSYRITQFYLSPDRGNVLAIITANALLAWVYRCMHLAQGFYTASVPLLWLEPGWLRPLLIMDPLHYLLAPASLVESQTLSRFICNEFVNSVLYLWATLKTVFDVVHSIWLFFNFRLVRNTESSDQLPLFLVRICCFPV